MNEFGYYKGSVLMSNGEPLLGMKAELRPIDGMVYHIRARFVDPEAGPYHKEWHKFHVNHFENEAPSGQAVAAAAADPKPNTHLNRAELALIISWYGSAHDGYDPSTESIVLYKRLNAELAARNAVTRFHETIVSAKKTIAEWVNNLPPDQQQLKVAAGDAIAELAQLEEYAADARQQEENS